MKEYFVTHDFVEVVNGKEVVLKEDVRDTEGYYEENHYALVSGETVKVARGVLTLPQALTLTKEEEGVLYMSKEPIQLKKVGPKKETRKTKTSIKKEEV